MRAVIYARYSTDKQRESSIADQARLCQARANAEGFQVNALHSDDGITGSIPVAQRPGGARMLADALADHFDVLIVEGLDRLSRDQVEQESLVRRLEYRGILIIGTADGYDSRMGGRKIMRGVRGLINDNEATWVRWMFARYAEGWSVQRIAHELNRLHVPSPRKGTWAVSALYGSPSKGSGILNNELYIGRYIWNRSQWVKDPDTGKRQRIIRPEAEWKITEVPALRIVDDELWQAARARMSRRGRQVSGGRSNTLFGGLMSCPHCSGSIVAINKRLYGCTKRKDRGETVCKGISFSRDVADLRLLGILKSSLFSPEAQRKMQEQVHLALAEKRKGEQLVLDAGKKRMAELDKEIDRLVDAIATVGISNALKSRLMSAEAERDRLQAAARAKPSRKSDAETGISACIKRKIMDLQSALESDTKQARQVIGELMGEIKIIDRPDAIYAEYDNAAQKLLMISSGVSTNLVAGAGFEPTTFGL